MIEPRFEHGLSLAGYKTRVLALEGEGVPIVMLHGYADSADTWRHRPPNDSRAARGVRAQPHLHPLLLIWTDRDRLALHHGPQRILDAVPDARLELLHGVGHCPQVEVPERFTELVLGFSAEATTAVS